MRQAGLAGGPGVGYGGSHERGGASRPMPHPVTEARSEIARLEGELDGLEAAVERCRKTALAARFVAGAGGLLLLLAMWRLDGTLFVASVAAVLGGIVLAGSTRATRAHLLVRIARLEAERAGIIDRLDIRPGAALQQMSAR